MLRELILLTIRLAFAFSFHTLALRRMKSFWHGSANLKEYQMTASLANQPITNENMETKDFNFDIDLALALGAHAFDVYNDPSVGEGKQCTGLDETTITYSSSDFIKRSFEGLLIGKLKKGEFRKETEEELTEKMVTGGHPDVYIKMHIDESESFRVLETFQSKVKANSNVPYWGESFSFYLSSDPSEATLKVGAFDEDVFNEDDLIGNGELKLAQLLANVKANNVSVVEVPVPIYAAFDTKRGWFGLGGGRKRKGTVMLELQYISFSSNRPDGTNETSFAQERSLRAPKGASPAEAKWEELLTRRIVDSISKTNAQNRAVPLSPGEALMESMGKGMHKVCSLDNSKTDTQASVWADYGSRHIVLSFRGTEQIKIKDVLTDINLVQGRFFPGSVEQLSWGEHAGLNRRALEEILIHRGFLSAFRSIEPAILHTLSMLMVSNYDNNCAVNKGWTVHVTGHSLGGALASLTAFDLARIARGYYQSAPTSHKHQKIDKTIFETMFTDDWNDPVVPILSASIDKGRDPAPSRFVRALRDAKLITYTYGAPRVGNSRFSQISDTIATHHYRVVNNRDMVPRMPRSSTANRLLEYSHAGLTVAVAVALNGTYNSIWIEGESEGTSPTQEVSPFIDKYSDMALPSSTLRFSSARNRIQQNSTAFNEESLFDLEEQVASLLSLHPSAARELLSSMVDRAFSSGQSLLMSKLPDALEAAGVQEEDLKKLDGLFKTVRELSGGIQEKFIEREFEMLASILDSSALVHHLEPSYYEALLAQSDNKLK